MKSFSYLIYIALHYPNSLLFVLFSQDYENITKIPFSGHLFTICTYYICNLCFKCHFYGDDSQILIFLAVLWNISILHSAATSNLTNTKSNLCLLGINVTSSLICLSCHFYPSSTGYKSCHKVITKGGGLCTCPPRLYCDTSELKMCVWICSDKIDFFIVFLPGSQPSLLWTIGAEVIWKHWVWMATVLDILYPWWGL